MSRLSSLGSALLAAAIAGDLRAQQPEPVDLSERQHHSMRDALGEVGRTIDDWIERFALTGFIAARYFDTADGGARPDGALGIQAATLFVDAGIRDIGSMFLEVRFDYFHEAGQNEVGVGEAYIRLPDVLPLTDDAGLHLKVGRFDLPFGEYYLLEDPDRNRLIGFPAVIPYRWDEGVMAFADFGGWGFNAAVTDGTNSRNSAGGIAPAGTLRLHARPWEGLYVSASGAHTYSTGVSALVIGAPITPVGGGASGASPSTEVKSTFGSADLIWQATEAFHLQLSAGGGGIDDAVDAFDRTLYWWMVEPTLTFAPGWQAVFRWSGVGTFDDQKGYRSDGRPYAAGVASYGFDLMALQRFQLCLRHEFARQLIGKVEVGFDHLEATDLSGLRDDTRVFTAAELVLAF
jgi:hypothetical protein